MDVTWQHTWSWKLDLDENEAPYLKNALLYVEPVVEELHNFLWYNVPRREEGEGEGLSAAAALPPYRAAEPGS